MKLIKMYYNTGSNPQGSILGPILFLCYIKEMLLVNPLVNDSNLKVFCRTNMCVLFLCLQLTSQFHWKTDTLISQGGISYFLKWFINVTKLNYCRISNLSMWLFVAKLDSVDELQLKLSKFTPVDSQPSGVNLANLEVQLHRDLWRIWCRRCHCNSSK